MKVEEENEVYEGLLKLLKLALGTAYQLSDEDSEKLIIKVAIYKAKQKGILG